MGRLIVLFGLDQLLCILTQLFNFSYKTRYLNEEVNRTEPSQRVSIDSYVSCKSSQPSVM